MKILTSAPAKKITLLILLGLSLNQQSQACTAVSMQSSDNSVIAGRTMDWSWEMKWELIYAPKGDSYTLSAPDNLHLPTIKGKTKYALFGVGSNLANDALLEGQNSAGLALSGNYLPQYTKYNEVTKQDKSYVSILELGKFILGNYATIEEVKQALQKYKVWSAGDISEHVTPLLHFIFTDRSGKSLVVEFVNGQTVIYDKNQQVLTNAPTYSWHMDNVRQYMGLTNMDQNTATINGNAVIAIGSGNGMWGLPGNYTPPARFVRATMLKDNATTPNNSTEAVIAVEHILNAVSVPKGASKSKQKDGSYSYDVTQWTSVKDITNNQLYFYDYDHNNNAMQIDLNKVFTLDKGFITLIDDLQYPSTNATSLLINSK